MKQEAQAAPPSRARLLCDAIVKSLEDDKAEQILVIDLVGKTSIADYMVFASGRSTRQVSAIAENMATRLKHAGWRVIGVEGKAQGDWVLVDMGDVIAHVFRPEVREHYDLEKMWTLPGHIAVDGKSPAGKRKPRNAKK